MPDKTMYCADCGQAFEWTEREQEFYESKDFVPPKRCKPCRDARNKRFADAKKAKGKSKGNRGSRGRSRQPERSGNRR